MLAFLLGTKTGRALSVAGLVVLAIIGARIWLVAHDNAIRQAEADKCKARIENMVSKAEADAIAAQLTEERRRASAATAAATEAQKRASAAQRAKDDALADLEARIAADKPDGRAVLTEEDMKWLDAR